ncbi:MAG: endonuclease MutS2 [Candidatus Zixiibacteriota bacterium]|nr:MAG: endonuclease MutS2 [candidate division Zixibacteria bacterium]
MNTHTLGVLEYKKIIDRIVSFARSVPGKRKASNLSPGNDVAAINHNLDLVSEMNDMFEFDGGPPGLEFGDLGIMLEEASTAGTIIEPKELLNYSAFFKTVSECQKIKSKYEKIGRMISGLVYPESVHTAIDRSIDISGDIKDSASPELKTIRRELRQVKAKLDEKFEKYLRGDTSVFLSDNIFTIREGRYVLPVREGDKGHVPGIIHDRSSSGATFFIEPSETVELNNRHRELETGERKEINRILRKLSEMLYMNLAAVKTDIGILSDLDFIAGCSRLSRRLNATRPLFSDSRNIHIKNGKHPVLVLYYADDPSKDVVPLTIEMSIDRNIYIITGPNTGGKTVALKTVGLLSLMAASGLFVPADENSVFILFDDIFADIGDEQSIDSSLSTYSSHLSHIKTALEGAREESLVLLDELGAGTDPDEGSAIGQAIVENLSRKNCFAVVTTHHGKLKALAGKVQGVVNGSMEFDTEKLQPTYRFLTGIPGSSFAVQIAEKLGMPSEITGRAAGLIEKKEQDLTALISELNKKLVELKREEEAAGENRLKYESLVMTYEEKLKDLEKAEKKRKKEQLKKKEEILKETMRELDSLLKEAKKKAADRTEVRRIRRKVSGDLEKTREEIQKLSPVPDGEPARGLPGETVYITGVNAEGEVLEPADSLGRVKVRVGNVTMLTDLKKLIRKKTTAPVGVASVKTDYSPEAVMELDIRGMTFEEAEPIIEKYLEDSLNSGLKEVSIIHGKGTGALRKKVQEYLSHNSAVESFRLGNWNEGASGVTVIKLKTG